MSKPGFRLVCPETRLRFREDQLRNSSGVKAPINLIGVIAVVIDAETSTWLQNVRAPNIRNVAAFEGNNHIFSGVSAPAAGVPDATVCSRFGLVGTGCVAVFGHF